MSKDFNTQAVNFLFDTSEIEEQRNISEEILRRVFDRSGLIDEILFSTDEQINQLNIDSFLESYAHNVNLDGLIKFLRKYSFCIDYINVSANVIVFKIVKVGV